MAIGFGVYEEGFDAEGAEQVGDEQPSGTVAGVYGHFEMGLADRVDIYVGQDLLQMARFDFRRIQGCDRTVRSAAEFARIEKVFDALSLGSAEKDSVVTHEFEAVPGCGIVTGGDDDGALSPQFGDE